MNTQETVAVVEHAVSGGGGLFDIDPGLMIWAWVSSGSCFLF
jgi:hypothetical protein